MRIGLLETSLCLLIVLACAALHFPSIYNPLGLVIQMVLSLLSFAGPISGMLYLSAAQVIPDPPNCPLTSSQLALLGFFLWQLRSPRPGLYTSSLPLVLSVAPFLLWNSAMGLLHGSDLRPILLTAYATVTGCAAATLARQSRNRLATCLVALLVGQAVAASVFWIVKLGLGNPVQAFNVDLYGDTTLTGARIGTARGNANMLGPSMALAAIGVLGYWFSKPSRGVRWRKATAALCLAVFALTAPALVASGSRGAAVAFAGGLFFLLLAVLSVERALLTIPIALAAACVVMIPGWDRLGLQQYVDEARERQQEQQRLSGRLIAGRESEWVPSVQAILSSPLIGGAAVKILSDQYQASPELWASHSTYLDAGLIGGFPGMILFFWFVAKPVVTLWRRRRDNPLGWLLAVYVVSAISVGTTSAMQMKHLWMLWGIASSCFVASIRFLPKTTRGDPGRKRPARKGYAEEHAGAPHLTPETNAS